MNMKELTHSQQQPQAPNAHKKKPTIRLTTRVTMLCAPQRSLLFWLLALDEERGRHTLSNQQAQLKEDETVNPTENAPKRHFQRLLVWLPRECL